MEAAARHLFRRHFGQVATHGAWAPGTLELLGSHAEINQGLVLLAAFERGVGVAASPRQDGRVELVMAGHARSERFWLDQLGHAPGPAWTLPIQRTLAGLRRKGVHCSGFNAAIVPVVPAGIGAGELEALVLAIVMAVRQLAPFRPTELGLGEPPSRDARGKLPPLTSAERMTLARWCAASVAGEGSPDVSTARLQAALLAKAWHVCCVDCKLGTVERASLVGEVLVLCDTGIRPPAGAEGLAGLRCEWSQATAKLCAKSLRSVELSFLRANRSRLTEREFKCAYHAVGEVQRVVYAEKALQEDDHRQCGHFMSASHESAAELLGNSFPEAELLAGLARRHPGCLGTRLMGDGFGGATLSLVSFHQVVDFVDQLATGFEAETGRPLKPHVCQLIDGP